MTIGHPRLSGPAGVGHPAVFERRLREFCMIGASGLLPLAISLAIAIAVPKPNLVLAVALILGSVGVIALIASSRLEVTVTILAIYLGLLDGPVKLLSGAGTSTSVVRNVLIFGVALGAILRLVVKRERISLPPMSGWVLGFVVLVLVEAFNPQTEGILKFLGGFRQQLQWVPFFFFGYVLMRSKDRLRNFFLVLGVIALANGVVATYQTQLSPGQLASWGPGYHQRIYGTIVEGRKKGGGRTYHSEGEGRVRPPALGSDSGFGGGVGVVALPCVLALLATWRARRRWIPAALCLAAMVAVATGLGRLQVIGAVIAAASFALLASSFGRTVTRPVATLLGIAALAIPLGALFIAAEGSGTFSRYESIAPERAVSTSTGYKSGALSLLPHLIAVKPFGVGLGSVGAAGGFGGKSTDLLEGHGVSAETQFNFMADELGLPGLILWVAFSLKVMVFAVRRLRRIADLDLRIALAGVVAPLVAMFLMGFSGPTSVSTSLGTYFFFSAGIVAYWFAGPGRAVGRAAPTAAVTA